MGLWSVVLSLSYASTDGGLWNEKSPYCQRMPNHSPIWEITQLITKWKQEPQKKILIVRANGIRAVKERSNGNLHEGEYYANLSGNFW